MQFSPTVDSYILVRVLRVKLLSYGLKLRQLRSLRGMLLDMGRHRSAIQQQQAMLPCINCVVPKSQSLTQVSMS